MSFLDPIVGPGVIELEATELLREEWFALLQINAVRPTPDDPTERSQALVQKLEAEQILSRGSRTEHLRHLMSGLEALEARGVVKLGRDAKGALVTDATTGELQLVVNPCRVVTRVEMARGPKDHQRGLKAGFKDGGL